MTKDFKDVVDNIMHDSTKDVSTRLYEIGTLHKALPKKEKNWSELAEYVGYTNGEAYRNFVLRRSAAEGTLPIANYSEMINQNEEYEKEYCEKTQIRDIYNAYRSDLRVNARKKAFYDELVVAAKNMPNIEILPAARTSSIGNEAILMLSDLHLGAECSNFYNTYNIDIAKERLQKLLADTIEYCKIHNVSKLNVCNLGDMIHGNIHETLRINSQIDVAKQLVLAAHLLAQFLNKLQAKIPTVVYRSVTDNHSRMTADKKKNLESENLSIAIDELIKEKLRESKIIFMDDNIDPAIMYFKIKDKIIIGAHGHLENPDKAIDNFCGAIKALPSLVLLGHTHNTRLKAYNGAKLLINGSIVGTEDYALEHRLFNPPEQTLLVFDSKNIINCTINLE